MGKLKDKLIDMGGYTKEGLSNLRNQDREVGPSQARMKGLKSDIGGMASKLDEIETAAKNKDKIKIRELKWQNTSHIVYHPNLNYVSCHWYMR